MEELCQLSDEMGIGKKEKKKSSETYPDLD
jgi:hypothetical protein